jgi:hypothetical protein
MNNNAVINNNYGRLQDLTLLFEILMGTCPQRRTSILEDFNNKHMLFPTTETLSKCRTERKKNPNCFVRIDEEQIRHKNPANGCAMHLKYKQWHRIVIQGLTDANCKLIRTDVGSYGKRHADGKFSRCCLLWQLRERLPIPADSCLPESEL